MKVNKRKDLPCGLESFLLAAVVRIDYTTQIKHSQKNPTVNTKLVLNSIKKKGQNVGKTVQTQKVNYSIIDLKCSSLQNYKDFIIGQNIIRLDADAS